MPQIVKVLLILAGVFIVIVIGFQVHWLLGIGLIAGLLIYVIYANLSTWYVLRGNAVYAQGDLDKALAFMEKAYKSKNANPQHHIQYAFLLMKVGEQEKAEKVLQKLLLVATSTDVRMQAKSNLATAYWLLNRQDEAIGLLEEICQDYKTVTVVGNLGYFKLLKGDLESALAFNEEAYEYDDNDLTITDNLAQNYYMLGRLDEAARMYEKVMAKSPRYADSYYYYAKTLEGLGRNEEAAEQAGLASERTLALVTSITKSEIEQLKDKLAVETDALEKI
ncbi:lipopolysaccharide assembly protein LapB [Paenibacillus sp. PAMC21692]|uniref:tetratricopeptide repeat protein n=1 Tax=Paenibacillus sp. PAMC21692 TaxID=2762320 RepID=UPI00164E31F9|nr:tetratricopeptide repeat protein [Paenibacillus sp. PAMC21692]QNK57910.1 tetratricopeptide repeat protein [Paenibacillus sp. PAMC21692]